jgi:hypothetical protein
LRRGVLKNISPSWVCEEALTYVVVGKGFRVADESFPPLHDSAHVFSSPLDTLCRLGMYDTRE